jgi:hypothetical protein
MGRLNNDINIPFTANATSFRCILTISLINYFICSETQLISYRLYVLVIDNDSQSTTFNSTFFTWTLGRTFPNSFDDLVKPQTQL